MKENIITFKLYGKYALFSDPIHRVGGEKCSYSVPTYSALKGVCESIFWKPTIKWEVLRVKILNRIETESKNMLVPKKGEPGENDLSIYTYLRNPAYIVQAKFVWNENRPDLAGDRNENKYYFMSKRMLERGGRRNVYLGTSECAGYVEPCEFDDEKSYYEETEINFGIMLHGINFPEKQGEDQISIRLWDVIMKNGVIDFVRPEDCRLVMPSSSIGFRQFTLGVNTSPVETMEKEGWLE